MAMEVEVDLVAMKMTEVATIEEEEVSVVAEEVEAMSVAVILNRVPESLMHNLEHRAN